MFIAVITAFLLYSCGLFSTRNPESPDSDKSTYLPPTSPDIVVYNFVNSILEKNVDNYLSCFNSGSQGSLADSFVYTPSSEAYTRYYALFDSWNINSERQAFLSLTGKLPIEIYPVLTLKNLDFGSILQDSAIISSDYHLDLNYTLPLMSREYTGILQFTIKPRPNGLWGISHWTDVSVGDTTFRSWSILKAQIIN